MMKSVCCASSTRDQIGWVSAMSSAGSSARTYATARGRRRTSSMTLDRLSLAVDAENAEEKACKDCLDTERQQNGSRDDLAHREPRIQSAKSRRAPAEDSDDRAHHAKQEHEQADHHSRLQLDVAKHRCVRRVRRMKSHLHRKHFREHREDNQQITVEATEPREQKRVIVKSEWSYR